MNFKINDLRTSIEYLKTFPNQILETDVQVDPFAEISGIYRYVGAGGTVKRPTKLGPAMIFNNVKGHENSKVLIGLLSSRERVGLLLNEKPEKLGFLLKDSLNNPIDPVTISNNEATCQEVVHLASDSGFDIRKLIPAPTNTEEDAGPYITMGMCYGTNPINGLSDITIHRLCLQSKDEISMYFVPGRHLDTLRMMYEKDNKPMPISISIGVDPAIEIASCFEPPTTPLGFNELSIAGGLRNEPVKLVNCLTVNEKAIANAEYVIEGELIPNKRIREDLNTNTGKAMPEFPGYTGSSKPELPVIKVKAVTHRKNPIMQSCIGPSEEHVNMAGIPTEASILILLEKALPGNIKNVYAHPSGGGKYMAIIQFIKRSPSDEGKHRQAALLAFAAFSELKHVILVDEDVDIFDSNDVLWAMNTRFQGDKDVITIPGVSCHPLDPSQTPEYSNSISQVGISCKTIFDCTVPFHLKDKFQRSVFKEVDIEKWIK